MVRPPVAKVRRGLGTIFTKAALPASAPNEDGVPATASARDDAWFARSAHNDVEAYLSMPIVDVPLHPDNESGSYWDPIDH